jgi:small multidrug resistance pump
MTGSTSYLLLAAAIAAELVATIALKATEGFTRLLPIAFVVAGYAASFVLLSICLQRLPLAFVYSVWAAFGMIGTAVIGRLVFDEPLDGSAFFAIALILAGVVLLARAMGARADV